MCGAHTHILIEKYTHLKKNCLALFSSNAINIVLKENTLWKILKQQRKLNGNTKLSSKYNQHYYINYTEDQNNFYYTNINDNFEQSEGVSL